MDCKGRNIPDQTTLLRFPSWNWQLAAFFLCYQLETPRRRLSSGFIRPEPCSGSFSYFLPFPGFLDLRTCVLNWKRFQFLSFFCLEKIASGPCKRSAPPTGVCRLGTAVGPLQTCQSLWDRKTVDGLENRGTVQSTGTEWHGESSGVGINLKIYGETHATVMARQFFCYNTPLKIKK